MEIIQNFVKSKTDKRLYRYFELANRLRCMVISDQETERSAASLDVRIGSFYDPKEYPGLAHFCEHMLFLGTKKFPVENEYSNFIKTHGGSKNAFTSDKDTNYYFSVGNSAFSDALDRFSQFFKEPLFNASSTDREIDAVNSEHKKNFPNDVRRAHQILVSQANPLSCVNRFSTGNSETLRKEGIRDRLIEFHKQNYSANLMTLVLMGNHPLETMEKWANEFFGSVENKNLKELDFAVPPAFDSTRLGKIYKIVPVNAKHILKVSWLFPDTHLKYKTKPADYLTHLLGHEGPNSLLSYLLEEQLVVSLLSFVDSKHANTDFLSAQIELTEKGFANYERILEIISGFAKMLREKGPQQYVFDEVKLTTNLKFQFRSLNSAVDTAYNLANTMHDYPKDIIQDVLSGPYTMQNYDPEEIKKLIDLMVPENMLAILRSPKCASEANLEEKWYKTKYSITDFSPSLLEKLRNPKTGPSIHGKIIDYPPVNNLLPKNIEILPKAANIPQVPRIIKETESSHLWYKQDHKFDVPKAYGFCRIWSNDNQFPVSGEAVTFAEIYQKIFFEDIREFIYMAELAGIECSLDILQNRITLSFYGFNDSLPVLVDSFLKKLKEFQPEKSEELFNVKKTQKVNAAKSILFSAPYTIAMEGYSTGLSNYGSDYYKKYEEIQGLTFEKFLYYSKHWLKNLRLEWYIAGNLSETIAIDTVLNAEKILKFNPISKDEITCSRTIMIPENTEYVLCKKHSNPDEVNSCLVSYFQGPSYLDSDIKQWCLNEVAFEIMKEPAFDTLRTKWQLGYIVFSRAVSHNRILGGRIVVQSDKLSPECIYQKINQFLEILKEKIGKLTDEEFKQQIEAVSVPLRQKPISLLEETTNYWKEIVNTEYLFERKEKQLEALTKLKKEEVVKYLMDICFNKVKRYDYEIVCHAHAEENQKAKEINKQDALKRGNKRIEVVSESELRSLNYIYPDIFLQNMKNNLQAQK